MQKKSELYFIVTAAEEWNLNDFLKIAAGDNEEPFDLKIWKSWFYLTLKHLKNLKDHEKKRQEYLLDPETVMVIINIIIIIII